MTFASIRRPSGILALLALWALAFAPAPATADDLAARSSASLKQLYATNEGAKNLGGKAAGVLVFPEIIKGGLLIGGAGGDGVLFRGGKAAGKYRSVAASYGLQFGISKYGYAMMFMSQDALAYLDKSEGWEVGIGPSVVVADEGYAGRVSTTTDKGVVVFFFDHTGFFAGGGVEGAKITKLD